MRARIPRSSGRNRCCELPASPTSRGDHNNDKDARVTGDAILARIPGSVNRIPPRASTVADANALSRKRHPRNFLRETRRQSSLLPLALSPSRPLAASSASPSASGQTNALSSLRRQISRASSPDSRLFLLTLGARGESGRERERTRPWGMAGSSDGFLHDYSSVE